MPTLLPLRIARQVLGFAGGAVSAAHTHHLKKVARRLDDNFDELNADMASYTRHALAKFEEIAPLAEIHTKEKKMSHPRLCCFRRHCSAGHRGSRLRRVLFFGALVAAFYVLTQKLFGKPTSFPPRADEVTGENNPGGGNYVFNTSTQPE